VCGGPWVASFVPHLIRARSPSSLQSPGLF
jgi:hypothetical protein